MLNTFLFKHIDNSALIVFRILFGLLCFLESVGAIFTGWVKRAFIEPEFTFNFIDFNWLPLIPGYWMYVFYAIMGVFGLFIMLGYKYRFAVVIFTLMWSYTYVMQKASYNNHYYLLVIVSFIMIWLPANKYASIDVKLNPNLKAVSMPNWCRWLIIGLLFVVYTYAAVAKIYPDWLDGTVMRILMKGKQHFYVVGELLQNTIVQQFLTFGGILFDGLVIPLLLIKFTRKWMFAAAVFFHLFNSFIFHIGIFPYLALAFCVFFFEAKIIRNIFLKKKPLYVDNKIFVPKHSKLLIVALLVFFLIQIGLPLRHHFFKGDVLWTEEGHRLSWRMMLRAKAGNTKYKLVNHTTGKTNYINIKKQLSEKQVRIASTKPDVMWQYAQHLKEKYKAKGDSVSVYVSARVSVNGKPYKKFTNDTVDIASVNWQRYKHTFWLLRQKE